MSDVLVVRQIGEIGVDLPGQTGQVLEGGQLSEVIVHSFCPLIQVKVTRILHIGSGSGEEEIKPLGGDILLLNQKIM